VPAPDEIPLTPTPTQAQPALARETDELGRDGDGHIVCTATQLLPATPAARMRARVPNGGRSQRMRLMHRRRGSCRVEAPHGPDSDSSTEPGEVRGQVPYEPPSRALSLGGSYGTMARTSTGRCSERPSDGSAIGTSLAGRPGDHLAGVTRVPINRPCVMLRP
jgi:hypothetical protein